MKWVTREKARVDRIACPWLIARFIDQSPQFLFVPDHEVMEVAEREGAIPYDVPDRKSTRLNSSHIQKSRMPSSA